METPNMPLQAPTPKPKSALAITGLILGIFALLGSLIPILNNGAFFVAILGLVFAIIGIVSTGANGKRSGRGLAIAALIVCIIAGALVLVSQKVYSDAIDDAVDGASVVSTDDGNSATPQTDLAAGQSVTLDDGLTVSVDAVSSVTNYDGSQLVAVQVTYSNGGSDGASYNEYDWKGETDTGSQEYATYYSGDDANDLNSGTLAAGGTVTGWLYFKEGTVKALYFSSVISDSATASWNL